MRRIAFAALLATLPAAVPAATFDLTTGPLTTTPSFSVADDGITATFDNVTFRGVSFETVRDADGLIVLDALGVGIPIPPPNTGVGFGQLVDRFEITFDAAVTLDSATVGFIISNSSIGGDEDLTFTSASGSTTLADISGTGPLGLGGLFVALGDTLVVTADPGAVEGGDLIQLSSLTVSRASAVIPLPPALPLLLGGLGVLGLVARRRA
ncbi:MAG: hypothetical protein AAGI34_07480 [Pseudomonadota bacterium]